MSDRPTVALVTTCKGRLHHVRETLPLMVGQGADQVILVDYDCPDQSGDWVEAHYPEVDVVRVADAPHFWTSRARNIGAATATTDWLVFIDADIKAAPGWVDWMRESLQPGHVYNVGRLAGDPLDDRYGTFICERSAFEALGGYDEVFTGWGGEDSDIYVRLRDAGVMQDQYPSHFAAAISHSNVARADFGALTSRENRSALVSAYTIAKRELTRALNRPEGLSLQERERLMKTVQDKLSGWLESDNTQPMPVQISLDRGSFPVSGQHVVNTRLSIVLEVVKSPDNGADSNSQSV